MQRGVHVPHSNRRSQRVAAAAGYLSEGQLPRGFPILPCEQPLSATHIRGGGEGGDRGRRVRMINEKVWGCLLPSTAGTKHWEPAGVSKPASAGDQYRTCSASCIVPSPPNATTASTLPAATCSISSGGRARKIQQVSTERHSYRCGVCRKEGSQGKQQPPSHLQTYRHHLIQYATTTPVACPAAFVTCMSRWQPAASKAGRTSLS
jgi:hypothetical protein